jgi:hypothetical protein
MGVAYPEREANMRSWYGPGMTARAALGSIGGDAASLARWHALGRVAMGAALTFAPGPLASAWTGSASPGARLLTSALGARDLGIGLGAALALGRGTGARPWVRAGVLADATDLVATLRARRDLPVLGVAGVVVMATGSTLLGLWLQGAVD